MSLRTDLLPVVDLLRGLTGPTELDIRTAQLTIRTRTWSGAEVGLGTYTDSDLVLPQQYKVTSLSTKEVASSGGRFSDDAIRFGPVTPAFTGGGYTPEQLNPGATADNVEVIHILTGQVNGNFRLASLLTERPFSYIMVLNRRRDTP
jgi:hypothetical protein